MLIEGMYVPVGEFEDAMASPPDPQRAQHQPLAPPRSPLAIAALLTPKSQARVAESPPSADRDEADWLFAHEHFTKALEVYRRVLREQQAALGAKHAATATTLEKIGETYNVGARMECTLCLSRSRRVPRVARTSPNARSDSATTVRR
jgi:hypothetical protein